MNDYVIGSHAFVPFPLPTAVLIKPARKIVREKVVKKRRKRRAA